MASRDNRALKAAFIILFIAGILVITATAITWRIPGTPDGPVTDKNWTNQPQIYVEAGTGLQYIPTITQRPINSTYFQPYGPVIPTKSPAPASSSPSKTSGYIRNIYVSNYSDVSPVPVRFNTTKSSGFPVSQTKPAQLIPLPTLQPNIHIVIPLPTVLPPTPVPAKTIPATILVDNSTDQVEQRIFYYTNIERVKAGKPAFLWDGQLSVIGRDHCIDMATTGLFDHLNFDGETPTDRAVRHGYQVNKDMGTYTRVGIGENIAKLSNYPGTADDVARFIVDAWMNSPGHRDNIMDANNQQLTLLGVGVAYDRPTATYYAAQEFF